VLRGSASAPSDWWNFRLLAPARDLGTIGAGSARPRPGEHGPCPVGRAPHNLGARWWRRSRRAACRRSPPDSRARRVGITPVCSRGPLAESLGERLCRAAGRPLHGLLRTMLWLICQTRCASSYAGAAEAGVKPLADREYLRGQADRCGAGHGGWPSRICTRLAVWCAQPSASPLVDCASPLERCEPCPRPEASDNLTPQPNCRRCTRRC